MAAEAVDPEDPEEQETRKDSWSGSWMTAVKKRTNPGMVANLKWGTTEKKSKRRRSSQSWER